MSQLRARPVISRRLPHVATLYGVRAVVFSRAGVLRRRDDYQLCGNYSVRCSDFSGVPAISGLYQAFDQFKNIAMDGLRHRAVSRSRTARL